MHAFWFTACTLAKCTSAEADRNATYPTLLAASLAKFTGTDVSQASGIDSEKDLFVPMAQARPPRPRLPEAQTAARVNELPALPSATQSQELGH